MLRSLCAYAREGREAGGRRRHSGQQKHRVRSFPMNGASEKSLESPYTRPQHGASSANPILPPCLISYPSVRTIYAEPIRSWTWRRTCSSRRRTRWSNSGWSSRRRRRRPRRSRPRTAGTTSWCASARPTDIRGSSADSPRNRFFRFLRWSKATVGTPQPPPLGGVPFALTDDPSLPAFRPLSFRRVQIVQTFLAQLGMLYGMTQGSLLLLFVPTKCPRRVPMCAPSRAPARAPARAPSRAPARCTRPCTRSVHPLGAPGGAPARCLSLSEGALRLRVRVPPTVPGTRS